MNNIKYILAVVAVLLLSGCANTNESKDITVIDSFSAETSVESTSQNYTSMEYTGKEYSNMDYFTLGCGFDIKTKDGVPISDNEEIELSDGKILIAECKVESEMPVFMNLFVYVDGIYQDDIKLKTMDGNDYINGNEVLSSGDKCTLEIAFNQIKCREGEKHILKVMQMVYPAYVPDDMKDKVTAMICSSEIYARINNPIVISEDAPGEAPYIEKDEKLIGQAIMITSEKKDIIDSAEEILFPCSVLSDKENIYVYIIGTSGEKRVTVFKNGVPVEQNGKYVNRYIFKDNVASVIKLEGDFAGARISVCVEDDNKTLPQPNSEQFSYQYRLLD